MKYILTFSFLLGFGQLFSQQHTVGVFINEPEAYDGYTFFSPMSSRNAYLIDNCGFLVNEWTGSNRPGLSGYLTDGGLMLRTNKVNGPFFNQASTGGNLQLIDWDNNVVWESDFNTNAFIQHHDARLLPNGNIIFIGWERISVSEQRQLGRRESELSVPDLWGEFIQEIKTIGSSEYEVVWEWHLKDHFIQDIDSSKPTFGNIAQNIGRININYLGPGAWDDDDWWHCNALDYHPVKDQILVNSRNNNELWIIDHSTTTEEAKGSTGGDSGKGGELLFRWGNPEAYKVGTSQNLRMYGSHGHYWIPEGMPNAGKIMYFNNGDSRPQGYYSTVEMLDPPMENGQYMTDANQHYLPNEPDVVYIDPDDPSDFVSFYLSNAQQLPNGNVLVNEGGDGHLFEVDENGEKVWEYISPVRQSGAVSQGSFVFNNDIFRAYKYAADHPALQGNDLTSTMPIEGENIHQVCNRVSTEDALSNSVSMSWDMSSKYIHIESKEVKLLNMKIVAAATGQLVKQIDLSGTLTFSHQLADITTGVYVINIETKKGNLSKKILVGQ